MHRQEGAEGENRIEWTGTFKQVAGEESAEHRPPALSWAECTWPHQVCPPLCSRPHPRPGWECSSASVLGWTQGEWMSECNAPSVSETWLLCRKALKESQARNIRA